MCLLFARDAVRVGDVEHQDKVEEAEYHVYENGHERELITLPERGTQDSSPS